MRVQKLGFPKIWGRSGSQTGERQRAEEGRGERMGRRSKRGLSGDFLSFGVVCLFCFFSVIVPFFAAALLGFPGCAGFRLREITKISLWRTRWEGHGIQYVNTTATTESTFTIYQHSYSGRDYF